MSTEPISTDKKSTAAIATNQVQADKIFEEEQAHLSETYSKLESICENLETSLEERISAAFDSRNDLEDNLAVDFGNGVNLETYVEYEAIHKIIDEFNLSLDLDTERLVKARTLLRRPYFAKISIQIRPNTPPRDLYIGAAGMVDENNHRFIIDWRAPVAEVYYNQSNGKTSYMADGRVIEADLKLRRQFDITGNVLHQYFDTTVAIEDALLLQSLSRDRSAKLQDITATIQREQNMVVRHEDVPCMIVNGIAGSGKTSVMLQRIAYLFFQYRDTLSPDEVYLITPNPVFRNYIDDVLPNMGERNPHLHTWEDLMDSLGLSERGTCKNIPAADLQKIDEALKTFELEPEDFRDLCVDEERVLSAKQAWAAYRRYGRFPAGVHRCTLAMEDLHEQLEQRIKSSVSNERVWDVIADMDEEEQLRIFGCHTFMLEERELSKYVIPYLKDRYSVIDDAIENGDWLRIDRIGMRLLGKKSISAGEWLYLKLSLVSCGARAAKFVMIDEVQDYTQSQLMVLAKYFNNAHFLMLGDENQAIEEGTVGFNEIATIFEKRDGVAPVECALKTSYRSTPEITQAFKTLMDARKQIDVASVRRDGEVPNLHVCNTKCEYFKYLKDTIEKISEEIDKDPRLVAVIVNNKRELEELREQLSEEAEKFTVIEKDSSLIPHGIVLLDLKTAKGLEFDHAILANVNAANFPETALAKRRLYTAISRATQKVSLVSIGEPSVLLDDMPISRE